MRILALSKPFFHHECLVGFNVRHHFVVGCANTFRPWVEGSVSSSLLQTLLARTEQQRGGLVRWEREWLLGSTVSL
jgi:hypothetical protein